MQKKIYKWCFCSTTILLLGICLLAMNCLKVYAENIESEKIRVRKKGRETTEAFAMQNMFPGDAETKEFVVKLPSENRKGIIYLRVDIREEYKGLEDVLQIKAELPDRETVLYEGLMKDMPSTIEQKVLPQEPQLTYRITASLDTSVGNAYQNQKSMAVDFSWWYEQEKEEVPETNPSESAPSENTPSENEPTESEPTAPDEGKPSEGAGSNMSGTAANTGDQSGIRMYIMLGMLSGMGLLIFFLFMIQKRKLQKKKLMAERDLAGEGNGKKKFFLSILLMAALVGGMTVTSFALGTSIYRVEKNFFQTGSIELDLNGGAPVITAEEFLFEPGMTVEKEFYIQNNSTWAVYCKVYFEEIEGELGKNLKVRILDTEGNVLAEDVLEQITEENAFVLDKELAVREKIELKVQFHIPKEAGNSDEGGKTSFRLAAMAVQTKNNPDREFE